MRAANPGVDVLVTSAREGGGLDAVADLARDRTIVLLGESGAGKSTLTNALVGDEVMATGAVRAGDSKGRHTTTTRELHLLPGGGVLIDTPGIRGVGLKTAHKLIREFRSIPHVIAHLRKTTNSVPMDYNAHFERADRTFLYQRVYCPFAKKLVHLNPPPKNVDVDTEWPFLGSHQDDEYARGVAEGQIDPVTREAMVDIAPDAFRDTPALRDETNAPVKVESVAKSNSLLSFFKPVPLDRSSSVKKATPVRQEAQPKVQDEKPEVRAHRPSKFFRSDTADAAVDQPVAVHDPVTLLSPRSSQAFVEAVKSEHDAPCELVSPPPATIARHPAFPAAPSSPSVRSPSSSAPPVRPTRICR